LQQSLSGGKNTALKMLLYIFPIKNSFLIYAPLVTRKGKSSSFPGAWEMAKPNYYFHE
jgi:hypothetical protein